MKNIFTTIIVLCLALKIQAQSAIGISLNAELGEDLVVMDGTAIYFNNSSDTVNLDDAPKLENPGENIAIIRGNRVLAVEQRTTVVETSLMLWHIRDLTYQLELTKIGTLPAIALEDRLLNTITYFQDTPVYYRFTSDTDFVYNRFRIIVPCVLAIDTTRFSPPSREKPNFGIYPNPSVNYLYIKGLPAGRHEVNVTNIAKKVTFKVVSDGVSPVRIDHNLPRGVYYLTVNNVTKPILIR